MVEGQDTGSGVSKMETTAGMTRTTWPVVYIYKPGDHGSRAGLNLTNNKPKKAPHFRVVRLTLVSCVCFGFTGQSVYVCVFIHDQI